MMRQFATNTYHNMFECAEKCGNKPTCTILKTEKKRARTDVNIAQPRKKNTVSYVKKTRPSVSVALPYNALLCLAFPLRNLSRTPHSCKHIDMEERAVQTINGDPLLPLLRHSLLFRTRPRFACLVSAPCAILLGVFPLTTSAHPATSAIPKMDSSCEPLCASIG